MRRACFEQFNSSILSCEQKKIPFPQTPLRTSRNWSISPPPFFGALGLARCSVVVSRIHCWSCKPLKLTSVLCFCQPRKKLLSCQLQRILFLPWSKLGYRRRGTAMEVRGAFVPPHVLVYNCWLLGWPDFVAVCVRRVPLYKHCKCKWKGNASCFWKLSVDNIIWRESDLWSKWSDAFPFRQNDFFQWSLTVVLWITFFTVRIAF